jgi:hypothetical protein
MQQIFGLFAHCSVAVISAPVVFIYRVIRVQMPITGRSDFFIEGGKTVFAHAENQVIQPDYGDSRQLLATMAGGFAGLMMPWDITGQISVFGHSQKPDAVPMAMRFPVHPKILIQVRSGQLGVRRGARHGTRAWRDDQYRRHSRRTSAWRSGACLGW